MRKLKSCLLVFLMVTIASVTTRAQTISGKVENSATKEKVAAVSVMVKGSGEGTFTDDKGNFKITVSKLPVTLLVSSVGYELQEITVTDAGKPVTVSFKPSNVLGQEVVVSATRTSQKILESPVSIERISAAAIRNAPAATYYDVISNLKGVDVVTSSLTFKTPTTRGFGGSGNARVNQIVDGMDNQAPGLNFSVGGFIGINELDVDNVELLPGASSALYGPGGMNGTILINSKNPFKYQGLSVQVKGGLMNVDSRFRSSSPYTNAALRFAYKVSDKFAFKLNGEFIRAKEWLGYDYRDYDRNGTNGNIRKGDRATNPFYDGVNVYGDETLVPDMRPLIQGIFRQQAPFLNNFVDSVIMKENPIKVSRTGYNENAIVDPNTTNIKVSGALHYKVSKGTEAVVAGYWGTGTTVYTGSDRYNLRNLKMGQYKIELNNKNWMLRAYTTQENAGESFNATVTTRLLNEAWKKTLTFDAGGNPTPQASDWAVQYAVAYTQARLNGLSVADAHTAARGVADNGRPEAGSAQFTKIFDSLRAIPISKGGGLFVDHTNLYQVEGQYNLSEYTSKFADILMGANFKRYVLNSEKTLFAEPNGKTGINEWGAYVQATKKLFNDVLKLTVSGRYDKNQNFKGRFTPRVTALLKVAENNNVRLSYQTAYRLPTTQQQWIDLAVGGGVRLIGGNDYFDSHYGFSSTPTYYYDNSVLGDAYKKTTFKPESVSSFELGYKGLLAEQKLLVDVYGYYGQYKDFITRRLIIQTNTNAVFSIPVNTSSKVKTFGWGLGLDYRLPKNFQVGVNASSDELKDVPAGFKTYFSTPKYRANVSLGNTGFGYKKRMGFNIMYRWQDAFYYESDFANGDVNAIHTLDAQISYKFPAQKILVKLGANNLLNEYYTNGTGNAVIGGLYYLSVGYNVF